MNQIIPENKIRFIDGQYQTLFHLNDGERIEIVHPHDQKFVRTAHYIDATHFKLKTEEGRSSGTYHICEFAEVMKRIGATYKPASQQ